MTTSIIEDRVNEQTTVPVIPTVGLTEYQQGELTARYCKDGVELRIDFAAGPVFLWMSHEDSRQLDELL